MPRRTESAPDHRLRRGGRGRRDRRPRRHDDDLIVPARRGPRPPDRGHGSRRGRRRGRCRWWAGRWSPAADGAGRSRSPPWSRRRSTPPSVPPRRAPARSWPSRTARTAATDRTATDRAAPDRRLPVAGRPGDAGRRRLALRPGRPAGAAGPAPSSGSDSSAATMPMPTSVPAAVTPTAAPRTRRSQPLGAAPLAEVRRQRGALRGEAVDRRRGQPERREHQQPGQQRPGVGVHMRQCGDDAGEAEHGQAGLGPVGPDRRPPEVRSAVFGVRRNSASLGEQPLHRRPGDHQRRRLPDQERAERVPPGRAGAPAQQGDRADQAEQRPAPARSATRKPVSLRNSRPPPSAMLTRADQQEAGRTPAPSRSPYHCSAPDRYAQRCAERQPVRRGRAARAASTASACAGSGCRRSTSGTAGPSAPRTSAA